MIRHPQATSPTTAALQMAEVGEMLARIRHSHQLRQDDAARLAGLSRNTIYRIENGDAGVSFRHIICYLEALSPGATFSELFDKRSRIRIGLHIHETRTQKRVTVNAGKRKNSDITSTDANGNQEAS